MNKQLPEANKQFENNNQYYSCPHGCGAVYHTYSFTHREFECKDCRQQFLVPEDIKLNKPKKFQKKKRPAKAGSNA